MVKGPKSGGLISAQITAIARQAEAAGKYVFDDHAMKRLQEREVTVSEVRDILRRGVHEVGRDDFNTKYQTLSYALRGKTIDRRDLRVVITMLPDGVLVISVVDPARKQ